jgi:hypothetical protein
MSGGGTEGGNWDEFSKRQRFYSESNTPNGTDGCTSGQQFTDESDGDVYYCKSGLFADTE